MSLNSAKAVWRNFPFVKHSIFLAAEGFVTKQHGRSARVLSLTESDIVHLYQVRGALEGLAARIIAERKLPLQDIESAMSAIQVAVASNDPLKGIDSVQRFTSVYWIKLKTHFFLTPASG